MANESTNFFPNELNLLKQYCYSICNSYVAYSDKVDSYSKISKKSNQNKSNLSVLQTYQQGGYLRKFFMTFIYSDIDKVNQYVCAQELKKSIDKVQQRIASAINNANDPDKSNNRRLEQAITYLLSNPDEAEAIAITIKESLKATNTLFGNDFHDNLSKYQTIAEKFITEYRTKLLAWKQNSTLIDNPLVDWFKKTLGLAEEVQIKNYSKEVSDVDTNTISIDSSNYEVNSDTVNNVLELNINKIDLDDSSSNSNENLAFPIVKSNESEKTNLIEISRNNEKIQKNIQENQELISKHERTLSVIEKQIADKKITTNNIADEQQNMAAKIDFRDQALRESGKKLYLHSQDIDSTQQKLQEIKNSQSLTEQKLAEEKQENENIRKEHNEIYAKIDQQNKELLNQGQEINKINDNIKNIKNESNEIKKVVDKNREKIEKQVENSDKLTTRCESLSNEMQALKDLILQKKSQSPSLGHSR